MNWPVLAAAASVGAVFVSVAAVLLYRHRTKKTIRTLERMLDKAIKGDFTEKDFDESMLSSLETRLSRYLALSSASARNLTEEKNKIKSLIADISHQTRTPISNIILYTQLLEEQELSEDSRKCISALSAQAYRLQMLIEALVKTSRLETGVIALNPSLCRAAPVIEQAAAQLKYRMEDKNISITVGSKDGEGVFDPKWTEEAVFNILDNAVKYTPEGGHIDVWTEIYPMFLCINVRDNGGGIEEEEIPKIFQRFYRSSSHSGQEGVGIGLYLVRKIAEGQGGYVKVSSKPEKGSVFSLYLPRE
ncbi:MAG: HAMP domain-containing sensor histidine kinase [Bacillota bacterium]|nr:HAMP domain-containing sensor histidine kinase [Bacillota bacterium]